MRLFLNCFGSRYNNIQEAAAHSDGLAVLATFFQIQRGDNALLTGLTKHIESVKTPNHLTKLSDSTNEGSTVFHLADLSLKNFLPMAFIGEFYRYSGSLTTPGCFESVTWTVFKRPLYISEGQMSFFRSLLDGLGQPLVNNFRPTQPLNQRY